MAMFRMFRMKLLLTLAACMALLLVAGSVPTYATCPGGISIALSKPTGSPFANCGQNAIGLFWLHHRGVYNSTALGVDSGTTYPNTSADPTPGVWRFSGDWGNSGVGDCPLGKNLDGGLAGNQCVGNCDISGLRCNPQLAAADCDAGAGDTLCNGIEDLGATDFVIAGRDPANPNRALALFGSVDLNECSQAYALDSLNAPAGNGDPCGATISGSDCNQVGPQASCAPVPFPTIIAVTPGTNSTTFDVSLPGSNIPYLDDCNVAESKAVNCPRLLSAGRVLMARRGDCAAPPVGDLLLSTAPGVRLWHPITGPTTGNDTDFNGNTGTSGTTPNPITLGSGANPIQNANRVDQAPHVVRIVVPSGPAFCVTNATGVVSATACTSDAQCTVAGQSCGLQKGRCINPANGQLGTPVCSATIPCPVPPSVFTQCAQCLYLGLGAAGDASPDAGSTQGIAPYISVNAANPIHLETATPTATPATDRVGGLSATKSAGKVRLAWDTSAELHVSGFKVMGEKKQGGQYQVGPSLIPAQGGTDGQGYHYTLDLSGGDLKGANKLFVVVVHPTGPDETFGPANL